MTEINPNQLIKAGKALKNVYYSILADGVALFLLLSLNAQGENAHARILQFTIYSIAFSFISLYMLYSIYKAAHCLVNCQQQDNR